MSFHIKPRIGVGEVHQSVLGDEDIAGLGHLGGFGRWSMIFSGGGGTK